MHPGSTAARRRHRNGVVAASAAMLPVAFLTVLLTVPGPAGAGVLPLADLTVQLQDEPDPVIAGDIVTFSIRVTNNGSADAVEATAEFTTDENAEIVAIRRFNTEGDDSCSEGTESETVFCSLGTIPGTGGATTSAFSPALADNEEAIEIDVVAPTVPSGGGEVVALADFTFYSEVFVNAANEGNGEDNTAYQDTTVTEGDSDSGVIGNNQSLSTVQGTQGNPVTTADPFALQLTNKSGAPLVASISEEPCNGQPGDELCNPPRLGGVLGNFQFEPATTTISVQGTSGPVVTIGKLYYDRTLKNQANGVRIFYQKTDTSPVLRLPRCDPMTTECFRVRNLASGDQIIRVTFSSDPRVTRG